MRILLAAAGLVACLGYSPFGARAPVFAAEDVPVDRLRIRDIAYPYDEGAAFALPLEKLPISVAAPAARPYRIEAPQGTLMSTGANRWTWEAPARPGVYPLKIKNPDDSTTADFKVFVMVPSSEVRGGMLNGFSIGAYPSKPLGGNPIYVPPAGYIEVTKENEDTRISPSFRIRQFLTKQRSGYPKYLVLDERLVLLLEAIGAHLDERGWDADDIFVMSGYRTPFYNKQLDDTTYSLHQWGRAADIFLDKDGNGVMDDFDGDRSITKNDAVALAGVLENLSKTPAFSKLIGGIGIYGATAAHGPFVHVDTRPWRARW